MILLTWLLASVLASAAEGPAEAGDATQSESPPAAEAPAEPEAELPRLPRALSIPAAIHPAAALAEGRGARVVVTLDVDELGQVVDAFVDEPVGDGFDQAVVAAATDWRFEPALDAKGRPVSARIQYVYTFTVATAPKISVAGTIREAGTRVPLAEVDVSLIGPDGATRSVVTDADGRFAVADLPEGTWQVLVTGLGLDPTEAELQVTEGKVAEVVLYPVRGRPWEMVQVGESIEVVGRAVAPEVTERVLDADEIRYLPGSNGDVVKAIQNLPGLARPPLGIGQLIVRGTSPEDSSYYVDGVAIPLAFHFGGLATVVPSDAIQEVAFLPGNFGARYGRVIGGAVDIRTTSELPERSNGFVSVDLFQATVFAEQRVSDDTAITVAGRRSYADAILNPILNGMDGVNIQAPRYYDLQGRVQQRLPGGGRLDALFLLSDDRFRFVGTDEDGEEEEKAEIGLTQGFRRLRLRYTQPLGGLWRSETGIGVGPSTQTFEFGGEGEAFEKDWAIDVRQEFYRPAPETGGVGLRAGVDTKTSLVSFLYDVPGFGASSREEDKGWRLQPAVYVEPTVRLGSLDLIPGLRADAQVLEDHAIVWLDPRLSAALQVGPGTRLKAAVGRYSQPPLARQVVDGGGGTPDLGPTWSLQSSVGVEQQVGSFVQIEGNAFYNRLYNVVVGREDAFRFFTGPPPVGPFDIDPWANDGSGVIFGVEGSVRASTPRMVALASITASRSSRVDRKGDSALFAYDQPIVANALASYKLPKRWRLGARARFSSGNPYTPVVNRIFNQDSRSFEAVYGERDSARLPNFWSLDVRVDKDWVFKKWTLTAYLDVQNATNNQNVEVMGWTYDFREESPTTSLPLLPAFGVRAEW